MKHTLFKKLFMIAAALGPLLIYGASSLAAATKESAAEQAGKQVDNNTQSKTAEKRKEIYSGAIEAIQETQNAMGFLDKGKTKEALSALESATGKLELILAREPKLAFAPSGVSTATYNILGGIDAVKQIRNQAEEALVSGHVQRWGHQTERRQRLCLL